MTVNEYLTEQLGSLEATGEVHGCSGVTAVLRAELSKTAERVVSRGFPCGENEVQNNYDALWMACLFLALDGRGDTSIPGTVENEGGEVATRKEVD